MSTTLSYDILLLFPAFIAILAIILKENFSPFNG